MIATHLPIRVLVVDDSPFMRNTLSTMLMKYPDVQVVGTARNGREALAQVARLCPDVMTLDVDMPEMNGLEVLERVMTEHPLPVVMVSSLTHDGAVETYRALNRGAFDFLLKQQRVSLGDLGALEARLYEKIKRAYDNKHRFFQNRHAVRTSLENGAEPLSFHNDKMIGEADVDCVIIGGSTGAPQILNEIVRQIPRTFRTPIVIVQHMPKFFTAVFSEQMANIADVPVREARDGDLLSRGEALIAPGDYHLTITRNAQGKKCIKISQEPRLLSYWPCIDLTLTTAAKQFGDRVLAVILSGMGQDGLVGCQNVKAGGGRVMVQDEASSTVYGMNRAVWEAGLADEMVSGRNIGQRLVAITGS